MKKTQITSAVFIILFITSCVKQQYSSLIDCQQIYEPTFSSFPTKETNIGKLKKWVVDKYAVTPEVNQITDGTTRVNWAGTNTTEISKTYALYVSKESQLLISFNKSKPLISGVIHCLGKPDFARISKKRAVSVDDFLITELGYSDKKLIATSIQTGKAAKISETAMVDNILIADPSSEEFAKLKPWPGRLEALTIDEPPK